MGKKPASETGSDAAQTAAGDPAGDPVSRFEASMKELEDIVGRMEHGDLPLEESLRLFERGVSLTRECRETLAAAELRVKNLLAPDTGADAGADSDAEF